MSEKDIGISIYFPWTGKKYSQISLKTQSLRMIWLSTEHFHIMGIRIFPDMEDCMSFH